MNEIHVLDNNTVDKIAAGEVVERPVSVVKELVENAIDAGSDHITVEIKEGGISLIRVTDDGSGIDKSQLTKAFMRHATSKITTDKDLETVMSLGFRGEALSSIAAVCQVEMITKTKNDLIGQRVCINGGNLEPPEEVGAPDGTTILVRNIFFNTPVRRKFLKTAMTEGSYINDFMQHIALSSPEVAFQFIQNGQTKFYTSGNGDIKEILYRIYGKEVSSQLIELNALSEGIHITGFLGKPVLNRSNRSYETFFVNNRYIKSSLISTAVEEGYKTFLMQHKYPFVVLHFEIDPTKIDVNVHPTKMDIRINEPVKFLEFIKQSVKDGLSEKSMISSMEFTEKVNSENTALSMNQKERQREMTKQIPQPFEKNRMQSVKEQILDKDESVSKNETEIKTKAQQENKQEIKQENRQQEIKQDSQNENHITSDFIVKESSSYLKDKNNDKSVNKIFGMEPEVVQKNASKPVPVMHSGNIIKQKDTVIIEKVEQMALFDEDDMKKQSIDNFQILGQVFDTYWILALPDKLYYVDQHAAHEKVMYERLMKQLHSKKMILQQLNPPIALTLSPKEKVVCVEHKEHFMQLGFELEEFGEDAYALRSVPMDLYGATEKEMFLSILDELVAFPVKGDVETVLSKIASMSCKAAVKGNQRLSVTEAHELMKELLACDNPYNCPHGRPTIISMSKYELEKKFKR